MRAKEGEYKKSALSIAEGRIFTLSYLRTAAPLEAGALNRDIFASFIAAHAPEMPGGMLFETPNRDRR